MTRMFLEIDYYGARLFYDKFRVVFCQFLAIPFRTVKSCILKSGDCDSTLFCVRCSERSAAATEPPIKKELKLKREKSSSTAAVST